MYTLEKVTNVINQYVKIESIKLIGSGNHSEAFLINNEIVVKMPKHKKASACLQTEIQVLNGLQSKLNLDIPNVLFTGIFEHEGQTFVFSASKKVKGSKLTREQFITLPQTLSDKNAQIIAEFLYSLHQQKQILPIKRKDLYLLHGDFSLNHVLFDQNNIACSVLDFGDARVGKPMSDFIYLLDAEDDEEFGFEFGNNVLSRYNKLAKENTNAHNI